MITLGKSIRSNFPIFSHFEKERLVYLDSAATSLKPQCVLDAMRAYYEEYSMNVHRGAYALAGRAESAYEDARARIARFIGADDPREIVFTRNATEAINVIARSWAGHALDTGDGILLTEMEHHANIVPWQEIAREKGFKLFFLPFDVSSGELVWDPDTFAHFLKERSIKLVSLTHVSNVFGTINPVREIAMHAHEAGACIVVDASQSAPHGAVNVRELGADFLAFSGHKMFGPTGIGVLWARFDLLQRMPPFLTGGDMVLDVRWEESRFQDPPFRFEAGTPHIAGAIGLAAAADYVRNIGMDTICRHEESLLERGMELLRAIRGVSVLGPADVAKRSSVISFVMDGIHPHDVGSFLDERGIMIRAGDHCAKPLHRKLHIPASSRMSISLYTDTDDIERACGAVRDMQEQFSR